MGPNNKRHPAPDCATAERTKNALPAPSDSSPANSVDTDDSKTKNQRKLALKKTETALLSLVKFALAGFVDESSPLLHPNLDVIVRSFDDSNRDLPPLSANGNDAVALCGSSSNHRVSTTRGLTSTADRFERIQVDGNRWRCEYDNLEEEKRILQLSHALKMKQAKETIDELDRCVESLDFNLKATKNHNNSHLFN